MDTRYDLKQIAELIANNVDSEAVANETLTEIYIIDKVKESDLIDLQFEFIGRSAGLNNYPTYKLGNLFAVFIGQKLHLSY